MHIPVATYRVQFTPSFGFQPAQDIVPYLADLGVSDLYASPIFKARRGSTHGYDVVDPTQLNPELGTPESFQTLVAAVHEHGLHWLQDIVPNHMAYDYQNRMLMDVLETGAGSRYYDFFDVIWDHRAESLRGRLLAPFLGKFYGDALEAGEIQLVYDEDGLAVEYFESRFPLALETYADVLTYDLRRLRAQLGSDHPDFVRLLGLLYVLRTLAVGEDVNGSEQFDQSEFVKGLLWELYTGDENVKRFVDENIAFYNGHAGRPESFDHLDALLASQHYRLSFWKVATEELNYRRFFNINELICLRTEDERVFDHIHSWVLDRVADGTISGLRVDHIDGILDPFGYARRIKQRHDVYLLAEKILDLDEELPRDFPVEGTTGYDFLNYTNGIFCRRANEEAFDRIYATFTDAATSYAEMVIDKKRLILEKHMLGSLDNLAYLLNSVFSRTRYGSDITIHGIRRALREIMVVFPVYRTYISPDHFDDSDRSYIREAVAAAVGRNPALRLELRFIERVLLLEVDEHLRDDMRKEWLYFVMRFQQFTGPLMAKGVEDTVLYIYNRLLSLNEVGGEPAAFGVTLPEFHAFNRRRAEHWPHSMNASSTHDTKRGEDARARINVLSEIPDDWQHHLEMWGEINADNKRRVGDILAPDRNDEYFLYQSLIGAFPCYEREQPAFKERLKDYVIKAIREAKVHTMWLEPDTEYEDAVLSFVDALLDRSESNRFLESFVPFQRRIAYYGIFNSLSQTLLKITAPGVPDFYQGAELWNFTFADPDNRRAVDFGQRRTFLREIAEHVDAGILNLIDDLFATRADGRLKLFLILQALQARTEHTGVFQNGDYIPLHVRGAYSEHVVAFARRHDDIWITTVVPRFLTQIVSEDRQPFGRDVWGNTRIALPEQAPSSWLDAITEQTMHGDELYVGDIFKNFPVALLAGMHAA